MRSVPRKYFYSRFALFRVRSPLLTDVYKRQVDLHDALAAAQLAGITVRITGAQGDSATCATIANGFVSSGVAPVSYTHLDVYKRQEEGKPGVEILPGYGPHLGLELLTERHGKAGQRV